MSVKISKKLLSQIEKKLLDEKTAITKQIEELKADDPFSDPDHVNDNAAVDTEVREQHFHQIIEAEINSLQKRLKDIDLALQKIKKDRYGLCAKCNKPIPLARLELIPEAQYCVECENKLKK